MRIKKQTKVEYTYAGGKVVPGVIVRQATGPHWKDEWYVVALTDEAGTYKGTCHVGQIRVTDNRQNRIVP